MPKERSLLPGVELARFVAALGVVVFHYVHFQYDGTSSQSLNYRGQPFYVLLAPMYSFGGLGVPLFWALSGVVFFHVYSKVLDEKGWAKRFWVARFSRLVPLHWLTLIIVIILQGKYFNSTGSNFVYPDTDWVGLFGNALLASHWVSGYSGQTYNGPIWSVSVELACYILFFVLLTLKVKMNLRTALTVASMSAFVAFLLGADWALAQAAFLFFAGGATYSLRKSNLRWGWKMLILTSVGFLALMVRMLTHSENNLAEVGWVTGMFYLVLPLIMFILAAKPKVTSKRVTNAAVTAARLGNLTYGMYLWHFPVQLGAVTTLTGLGMEIPFDSPAFFIFYLTAVLVLSAVGYKFFELPAKQYIRRTFR